MGVLMVFVATCIVLPEATDQIRPLPYEEVFIHMKRIDNSRLVREGETVPPPERSTRSKLSSGVEAVVTTDLPVATRLHRAVAFSFNFSLTFAIYCVGLAVLYGAFSIQHVNLRWFILGYTALCCTYGFVWASLGVASPGMTWAHLAVRNFDGREPTSRQLILRFIGSTLSCLSMLGFLWALADEEGLTWADHISGTFCTIALTKQAGDGKGGSTGASMFRKENSRS
jgi:uncharacterized RDD family membrane protein YckC